MRSSTSNSRPPAAGCSAAATLSMSAAHQDYRIKATSHASCVDVGLHRFPAKTQPSLHQSERNAPASTAAQPTAAESYRLTHSCSVRTLTHFIIGINVRRWAHMHQALAPQTFVRHSASSAAELHLQAVYLIHYYYHLIVTKNSDIITESKYKYYDSI